jgi:dihydrofolate synthase/folylpolyglutamate synthase
MQRLTRTARWSTAPEAELWLDGGHNPAAGEALAEASGALPARPTHLICGMMNTKDVRGYMRPLAAHAATLTALSIPGEVNTLPAEETAQAPRCRARGDPCARPLGAGSDLRVALPRRAGAGRERLSGLPSAAGRG